jgi:hypothetical protein
VFNLHFISFVLILMFTCLIQSHHSLLSCRILFKLQPMLLQCLYHICLSCVLLPNCMFFLFPSLNQIRVSEQRLVSSRTVLYQHGIECPTFRKAIGLVCQAVSLSLSLACLGAAARQIRMATLLGQCCACCEAR